MKSSACLQGQAQAGSTGFRICTSTHDVYEQVSVMVDSGASETVASEHHFANSPLVATSATGTTYSSAAANPAETIMNLGEKYVEVTDINGKDRWAKLQICSGLGRDKIVARVNRLVQVTL